MMHATGQLSIACSISLPGREGAVDHRFVLAMVGIVAGFLRERLPTNSTQVSQPMQASDRRRDTGMGYSFPVKWM
jgi:hypothetical protein